MLPTVERTRRPVVREADNLSVFTTTLRWTRPTSRLGGPSCLEGRDPSLGGSRVQIPPRPCSCSTERVCRSLL
jgi:hypothetical protein